MAHKKTDREKRLDDVWRRKHNDYKGRIDGRRYVLVFVPTKGTCSVPLDSLTDDQIAYQLGEGKTS
ncbi:MAG: hypothetical protein HQ492_00070 [Woeseiaceae bacterium]|nr:hypothetical protein [Woeseiaceae bacterium]